jgi:hypothetical protein
VHLRGSDDAFIRMIQQKLKPEQIISLHLNTAPCHPRLDVSTLSDFTNVISLTLVNLERAEQIEEYTQYFPHLTSLIIWHDNEVSYNLLTDIIHQAETQIKRLKIRCAKIVPSSRHGRRQHNIESMRNSVIESFLIGTRDFPLAMINTSSQCSVFYGLAAMIDLVMHMSNLRYIRVTTKIRNSDILTLLDEYEWKRLVKVHRQLKKVALDVLGNIIQNKQSKEQVLKIQEKLCTEQQTIKFQVNFI